MFRFGAKSADLDITYCTNLNDIEVPYWFDAMQEAQDVEREKRRVQYELENPDDVEIRTPEEEAERAAHIEQSKQKKREKAKEHVLEVVVIQKIEKILLDLEGKGMVHDVECTLSSKVPLVKVSVCCHVVDV